MPVETLTIAKPDDCEEVAKFLEDLAAEARAGSYIAFTGIFIKPGGNWSKRSYVPHSRQIGAPEMIGYLFTAMHDLADETRS